MRRVIVLLVLAVLAFVGIASLQSTGTDRPPDSLVLPRGFQPEGITRGEGTTVYVGSIPTGAIYRGDVRTGRGSVLIAGRPDRAAIGLEEADGRLYVAGGATGRAFVYDTKTGGEIAAILLATTTPSFVNDVAMTADTAYFTDSLNPVLYRVDRATLAVTALALTGDIAYEPGFNANGIEATDDGRTLVSVQTNTGRLFRVDSRSGVGTRISLGDESLPGGDGLLLSGRTLYAVQNRQNRIAVINLSQDLTTGVVNQRISDPRFDTPTTLEAIGSRLYVVNAQVDAADASATAYRVVTVDRSGGD